MVSIDSMADLHTTLTLLVQAIERLESRVSRLEQELLYDDSAVIDDDEVCGT